MDLITTIVAVAIGLIVGYVFVFRGIFVISQNQVGVLTKKFGGRSMPPGQIIARRGEVGTQAKTLMPGMYWRFPIIWSHEAVAVTVINPGQIGLVESIDGNPLTKGRLFADEVSSNHFQDAEAFLDNKGMKGLQIATLNPGTYRINTKIFKVKLTDAIKIDSEEVGIVIAQDGQPLPKEYLIAPSPLGAPDTEFPNAKNHRFFQDGQAFIDSKGYRGPQFDTLQAGEYYINSNLFMVQKFPIFEVPPGFVAILRSNVGPQTNQEAPVDSTKEEKAALTESSTPVTALDASKIPVDIQAKRMLIDNNQTRGIWDKPLNPGKYNLNTIAYTAYLVPTSAVTIDWAASTDLRVDGGASSTYSDKLRSSNAYPRKDATKPALMETSDQTTATSFFKFSQLRVTSQDGFELGIDVRMIMRILPDDAGFVIARFGSVENLIEQIVHPLIDSSFRNKAGEKKAIDFIQSRSAIQQEALERAKSEFIHYKVVAQNLLIAYIEVDESLLKTQTDREIALQQQAQYQQQAKAEEQRIAVQEKKARADKQPDVVAAMLAIEINKNNAQAAIEQANGIRDSTRIKAEGEAQAIKTIGDSQAAAYKAQADVLGASNITMINVMDKIKEGKVQITPQVLVNSGPEGGNNGLISAWFASSLGGDIPPYGKKPAGGHSGEGDTQDKDSPSAKAGTKDPLVISAMTDGTQMASSDNGKTKKDMGFRA